jgi:hypothetical protein
VLNKIAYNDEAGDGVGEEVKKGKEKDGEKKEDEEKKEDK